MILDNYIYKNDDGSVCQAINHSGGAIGSDYWWGKIGQLYDVKTLSYSFLGHSVSIGTKINITKSMINEAYPIVKKASDHLGRLFPTSNSYVNNLLVRNYFPALYSDSIVAIGTLINYRCNVDGGTGWAVDIGKILKKKVYVYDISDKTWYTSFTMVGNNMIFQPQFQEMIDSIPKLTKSFAGIGTRGNNGKIPSHAIQQIEKVYDTSFKKIVI